MHGVALYRVRGLVYLNSEIFCWPLPKAMEMDFILEMGPGLKIENVLISTQKGFFYLLSEFSFLRGFLPRFL